MKAPKVKVKTDKDDIIMVDIDWGVDDPIKRTLIEMRKVTPEMKKKMDERMQENYDAFFGDEK